MAYKGNNYYFWKSDGTESATVPILEIEMAIFLPPKLLPGFTTLNNSVYFYSPTNRNYPAAFLDLMKEDPSGKITTLSSLALWDYYDSRNQMLVKSGNYLYMSGRENIRSGYSLLKTDGTSPAHKVIDTYSLKDQSSSPDKFLNINNIVYFTTVTGSATMGDEIQSLWKTDGTSLGTSKIAESLLINSLADANGVLYFATYEGDLTDIYKSNGTAQGTVKLGLTAPTGAYFLSNLKYAGTKLFFTWSSYPGEPVYLWMHDGVNSKQLGVFDFVNNLQVLGERIYYEASTLSSGSELWRSDGTIAGTVMVKDIIPGKTGSSAVNLIVYNNLLFFTANDGVNGFELWRSNGTSSGTFMLKDLSMSNSTNGSGGVQHFKAIDNVLYFTSTENSISRLWKTNGTAAGTVMIKQIPAPAWLMDGGNKLFFITESGTSFDLWKSNGMAENTEFVSNLPLFYSYSRLFDTFTLDSVTYFSNAQDLWRSDGTSCGTFTVPLSIIAFPFDHIGNEIIFAGADRLIGTELFKINASQIVGGCASFAAVSPMNSELRIQDISITNYPNPFQGAFELKLSGSAGEQYAVAIYDRNNVLMERESHYNFNETYALGSTWPAGLYLMKITNGDKITVTRIFKNR
jgi:ELWxxDGT repeat protein